MGVAALLAAALSAAGFARELGGSADEEAYAVAATPDGGYVVAGYTESFGAGWRDALVVKLDGAGNLLWARTLGSPDGDYALSVAATPDGGCVAVGRTGCVGADSGFFLMAKWDSVGALQWARAGPDWARGVPRSLVATMSGGYELFGSRYGWPSEDFLFVACDSAGAVLRSRLPSFSYSDDGFAAGIETADGSLLGVGFVEGVGAGMRDLYVYKRAVSDTGWPCWLEEAYFTDAAAALGADTVPLSRAPLPLSLHGPALVALPAPVSEDTWCAPQAVAERAAAPYEPPRVLSVPGGLTLSASVPTSAEVYAADGRLVRALTVRGPTRVRLSRGVYLVRFAGRVNASAVVTGR